MNKDQPNFEVLKRFTNEQKIMPLWKIYKHKSVTRAVEHMKKHR